MEHRAVWIVLQRAPEFPLRLIEISRTLFRDADLDECTNVVGRVSQSLVQFGRSTFQRAAFPIRDLEVSAGDAHSLVECERS